jgi:hypothetical protein
LRVTHRLCSAPPLLGQWGCLGRAVEIGECFCDTVARGMRFGGGSGSRGGAR